MANSKQCLFFMIESSFVTLPLHVQSMTFSNHTSLTLCLTNQPRISSEAQSKIFTTKSFVTSKKLIESSQPPTYRLNSLETFLTLIKTALNVLYPVSMPCKKNLTPYSVAITAYKPTRIEMRGFLLSGEVYLTCTITALFQVKYICQPNPHPPNKKPCISKAIDQTYISLPNRL
jgi:hypothetical protein